MVDRDSGPKEKGHVRYIDTDNDCQFCLADVKDGLTALLDVDDAESSPGCLW